MLTLNISKIENRIGAEKKTFNIKFVYKCHTIRKYHQTCLNLPERSSQEEQSCHRQQVATNH